MALTFNATYYFTQRPDVLNAYLANSGGISAAEFALNHYNTFGWKEGANPNEVFITTEYLAENPDVAAAGVNPFTHYQQFGQAEGRAPNATFPSLAEFDFQAYIDANADLRAAGIDTAAEAYDHYITFGYAESRPGAPDSADFLLAQAFANQAAAQEAVTDYLEGQVSNEYLVDNQGVTDASSTAAVRTAIGTEYTAAASALATSTNLTNFGTRSDALQDQAIADTRAALQTPINALNADIAGVTGLAAAIARYNAANEAAAATGAPLAAAGTNAEAALAAYNVLDTSGPDFTFESAGGTVDLTADPDLVDSITEVTDGTDVVITMNGAGTAFVLNGVTEASNPGVTALLNALNAALAADNADEAAATAATNAATNLATFDAAVAADADLGAGGAGYTQAVDVAADLNTATGNLETFNEEVARFENADALADALAALDANAADAADAFEALGYEVPNEISGAEAVTADADLFVFADDSGVIAAGLEAEDAIYFGRGYTVSTLADDFDINGSADVGSVSALEIFMRQEAGNTVIYVENNTYDGQANGTWAGETITLTGVSIENVSIDSNGILRVSDVAVA